MWVTVLIMVIIISKWGVGVLKGSPWGQVGAVPGEGRLRDFPKLLPEQQPGRWSEALAG